MKTQPAKAAERMKLPRKESKGSKRRKSSENNKSRNGKNKAPKRLKTNLSLGNKKSNSKRKKTELQLRFQGTIEKNTSKIYKIRSNNLKHNSNSKSVQGARLLSCPNALKTSSPPTTCSKNLNPSFLGDSLQRIASIPSGTTF